MKKLIGVWLLSISLYGSNSFAQGAPGDSGSGGGFTETSPLSLKRNNGNGTCGGEAEFRVAFSTLPDDLPIIAQVRSDTRDIPGIVIDNIDASPFVQKGYISYCVSSANILPAVKLSVRFHYEKSNKDFWIEESYHATDKGGRSYSP